MTTPTHNSPQVAHTTTERAQLATGGAIPEEDLAELRWILGTQDYVTLYKGMAMIWTHATALLAAYERDQERYAALQISATEQAMWTREHIAALEGAKAHMDYCRTLVPMEDGDDLADVIEAMKQRIAELEALHARLHVAHSADLKRIAELEADRMRLDWVLRNSCVVVNGIYRTSRESLDDAIAEQALKGGAE